MRNRLALQNQSVSLFHGHLFEGSEMQIQKHSYGLKPLHAFWQRGRKSQSVELLGMRELDHCLLAIMGVSFHVGWARTFLVGFSSRSPRASYRTLTRSSSVSPCELSVLEGRHPEHKQVKRYIYTCWSNMRFEKRLLPQGFWFWVHLSCCNILFLIKKNFSRITADLHPH